MSIPFRQYLLPDGRVREGSVDRPSDVERAAQAFIDYGGRFECEVLTTGHVSLTAAYKVDGEWDDIAIRLSANGPEVLDAVDDLVKEAAQWAIAQQLQASDTP